MNFRKTLRIIAFELSVTLRGKRFWIDTFIVPAAIVLGVIAWNRSWLKLPSFLGDERKQPVIGFVDETGLLVGADEICSTFASRMAQLGLNLVTGFPALRAPAPNDMNCVSSLDQGLRGLKNSTLDGLLVIPSNFLARGAYQYYATERAHRSPDVYKLQEFHRRRLVETAGLAPDLGERLLSSVELEDFVVGPDGVGAPRTTPVSKSQFDPSPFTSTKIVAYLVVLFALIGLYSSAVCGFLCTQAERSSHLIEVILSSVTPLEYLTGKVFASILLSWLQAVVMSLAAGLVLWNVSFGVIATIPFLFYISTVSGTTLLIATALFCLSALMVAALGAGIGVLSRPGETARSTLPILIILQGPLMFGVLYAVSQLENPAVRAIRFIPPLNAQIELFRLVSGESNSAELWFSMFTLVCGTFLSILLASRLMKICLTLDSFAFLSPKKLFRSRA